MESYFFEFLSRYVYLTNFNTNYLYNIYTVLSFAQRVTLLSFYFSALQNLVFLMLAQKNAKHDKSQKRGILLINCRFFYPP